MISWLMMLLNSPFGMNVRTLTVLIINESRFITYVSFLKCKFVCRTNRLKPELHLLQSVYFLVGYRDNLCSI